MIDEIVDSGVIGKVTSLTANLGYVLLILSASRARSWRGEHCWIWRFIPSILR